MNSHDGALTITKVKMPKKMEIIKPTGSEPVVKLKDHKVLITPEEITDFFKQMLKADQLIKEALKDGDIKSLNKSGITLF
jgi:hypothetical protein